MTRARVLLAGLALALAVPHAAAAPAPATPSPDAYGPGDLRLERTRAVDDRAVDHTFTTPALAGPTTVRVVLPAGYDAAAGTRYPVLLLLHGGAGGYTDWHAEGVDRLTAGLPLIVVLPDAGRSAWYTDWHNNGRGGPPMWETYHLGQLVPWIDAHYRTVGDRAGRAVAGLSSGGFGAMSYASRHPDLFVAAAAFSGAVDTNTPPVVAGKFVDALAAQDGGGPGSLFGLREVDEVRWRGHNPWDLAGNLRGMSLTLRAGNGMAGGRFGGGGPTDPLGSFLERGCYDMSVSLHGRLDALGIDHLWDDYGPGTHSYDYWRDDLAKTLPAFMAAFAERRPDPSPFTYRSIESNYEVFGWQVLLDRPVVEFSALQDVTERGFTLAGSGTATVLTAPVYAPGRAYEVRVGTDRRTLRADGAGRLRVEVDLGPPNPMQQRFTPAHDSPGTAVHSISVRIRQR